MNFYSSWHLLSNDEYWGSELLQKYVRSEKQKKVSEPIAVAKNVTVEEIYQI